MRRLLLLLLTLTVLGLLLAACGRGGSRTRNASSCEDVSQCEADPGELAACVDGDCEIVQCLTSADCPTGSYCDNEDNYECIEGCESNADCLAGEECGDDGTCAPSPCRSTELDCKHGEFCNSDSGACEPWPGNFCSPCDAIDTGEYVWDDQGTFTNCDDEYLGHVTCGGGAVCLDSETGPGDCYPPCGENDACPYGFFCGDITINQDPSCDGGPTRVIARTCFPMLGCDEFNSL
jgi:hypothetical protein